MKDTWLGSVGSGRVLIEVGSVWLWFCGEDAASVSGIAVATGYGRHLSDGHVSTVVGGHSVWDLGGNWFGEGGERLPCGLSSVNLRRDFDRRLGKARAAIGIISIPSSPGSRAVSLPSPSALSVPVGRVEG
jgi:hypothetical protein